MTATKPRIKSGILQDIITTMYTGECRPTRIQSLSNTTYTSFKKYTRELIDKGIVMTVKSQDRDRRYILDYKLTDKGQKIAARVRDFDDIRRLLE